MHVSTSLIHRKEWMQITTASYIALYIHHHVLTPDLCILNMVKYPLYTYHKAITYTAGIWHAVLPNYTHAWLCT